MPECIFDSGTTPNYGNSKWQIEQKILCALNDTAGGGGGGQMMVYTGSDPTSDGLVPNNVNAAAMAYSQDGSGNTYVWNTSTHAWN